MNYFRIIFFQVVPVLHERIILIETNFNYFQDKLDLSDQFYAKTFGWGGDGSHALPHLTRLSLEQQQQNKKKPLLKHSAG